VVREIRSSRADCIFIGMPSPRKERFIASHRDALGVQFIMGVGGSFDILAGAVRRAPVRMQHLGLEWLYRFYQEPGRMWWRYAKTNTLLAQATVRQSLSMAPRANSGLPPGTSPVRG
jgi:N-acetylglucosaminyldiphosphoundecaprenol N-acetyl-beta-D-mannosaminyltransferase